MRDDGTDLPVRPVQAWADGRGNLHTTKEAALLVEIERILGHLGGTSGESMAPGIARLIAEKRNQLIPLLAAFGSEVCEATQAISLEEVRDKRAG